MQSNVIYLAEYRQAMERQRYPASMASALLWWCNPWLAAWTACWTRARPSQCAASRRCPGTARNAV